MFLYMIKVFSAFRSIDDISISVNGVEKLLNNLDPKTASGLDGITARFLKVEAKEVSPILSVIFQKSPDTGGGGSLLNGTRQRHAHL